MSRFINNYKPPTVTYPTNCHLNTPPEEYDFNYVFEVKTLQSDRVELRPFVPSLHAKLLFEKMNKTPDEWKWLSGLKWPELNDTLVFVEKNRRDPSFLLYAIYTDKPGFDTPKTDPEDYVFAGSLGMINSSYDNMMSEPGWIMIMPEFQRTHVLTHAAGLVMHRCLDMPKDGGLGLRRCQWVTTTLNQKSQNAAIRLGFSHEGVFRNLLVLPKGAPGIRDGRDGDYKPGQMNRDSWFASVTWQEWEERVRDHVDKLMARRK